nr:hypothetical protein [Brucella intermedia]
MSEKLSEKSEMSELVFASKVLKSHIAPPSVASGIGARILAASRALKWSFNRTKDVWYADERVSIKPRELRKLEEVSGVKYGQQELSEVEKLISRAQEILGDEDKDLARSFLAAFRAFLGAVDRPRA